VTIYYRFHPLRAQTFPVVRRYDPHGEPYYVVRRADGRPLAVPAWMTRPEAAYAEIIPVAHLPTPVLLELRRVTVTWLSSSVHNPHEEDLDAAIPNEAPTTTLRRDTSRSCRRTSTGGPRAVATGAGAVDAGAGQDDPHEGGRR